MLLSELLEELQNFQERHPDEEIVVLGTHQPSYPLRERVAGVYSRESEWEYARMGDQECQGVHDMTDDCADDENDAGMGYWNDEVEVLCPFHYKAMLAMNEEPLCIEIVLDGASRDHNPYGSRKAWSMS